MAQEHKGDVKENNNFSQAWRQKVDKARIKTEIAKCKDCAPIFIEYCAGERVMVLRCVVAGPNLYDTWLNRCTRVMSEYEY
jgi:hypothetical protein